MCDICVLNPPPQTAFVTGAFKTVLNHNSEQHSTTHSSNTQPLATLTTQHSTTHSSNTQPLATLTTLAAGLTAVTNRHAARRLCWSITWSSWNSRLVFRRLDLEFSISSQRAAALKRFSWSIAEMLGSVGGNNLEMSEWVGLNGNEK